MVLFTAMIRALRARFGGPVDILTSGPWSEPLLHGQPGVGEVWSVRSRKTPYWLSSDQRRVVRRLRGRAAGPVWFCDGDEAARPLLRRAGIPDGWVVDVKHHPLLPGEHATEQWVRLAQIDPPMLGSPTAAGAPERAGGCHLTVSEGQRTELKRWLKTRGLGDGRLIAIQIGNKRTMRRGLRRLAVNPKHWPNERWAQVLRAVRERCPNHQIVLLGTGPEYELNDELARLAAISGLHNLADDLPVPRLVALLAQVSGLITVDSGPAHAAAAVGCPLVVLFGKALPSLYRPWGTDGADVKVLAGKVDGEPDMLGIEAGAVLSAWAALKLRGGAHP